MATVTISTSNTTVSLGGILGIGNTTAALTAETLTGVQVNLGLGAISNFVVDGSQDSNVIVDDVIGIVSTLTLDTDGADFTLNENGAVNIAILSGTTIDINNGGTFQASSALISASILSQAEVGFGTLGGSDIITKSAGFIAIDLLSSAGPITGFNSGSDVIIDEALDFAAVTGYSVSSATSVAGEGFVQTITVLAGNGVAGSSLNSNLTFAVAGDAALNTGSFATDAGPLNLTADDNGVAVTVCFLAGTMIATPDGEKAIEALKASDLILTADGRAVPVRWIGINTVATRFADPQRNMPIRISAGALGENAPKRDLLLSPDHALLLDGVLVQANALVDGVAIRRETQMPETFRYYHIEVEAHDLILAEGVASETFVDNVSRMAFDNWAEFMELCNGEPPTGEMSYPRAKSQRQLPETLRGHLAARAAQLQSRTAA
jgi:hypothetical protein